VLLHHVMGEIDGHRGVWAYAEGGMGAVSAAIARSALAGGAHIAVNAVRLRGRCTACRVADADGRTGKAAHGSKRPSR